MSTVDVQTSLSLSVALRAFRFLVDSAIRGRAQGAHEFRAGDQNGYIACLVDHYGSAKDDAVELAYDRKETWSHVTADIVAEYLSDWAESFENLESADEVDYESMMDAIGKAVDKYALQHPRKIINALKYI